MTARPRFEQFFAMRRLQDLSNLALARTSSREGAPPGCLSFSYTATLPRRRGGRAGEP